MSEMLANFLKSILRSLFVSVVLSIIVFSAITKQFPPDFARLKEGYQKIQELQKISEQLADLHKRSMESSIADEEDVNQLSHALQKRAAAAQILDERNAGVYIENTQYNHTQEMARLQREVEFLKARVLSLEDHMRVLQVPQDGNAKTQ